MNYDGFIGVRSFGDDASLEIDDGAVVYLNGTEVAERRCRRHDYYASISTSDGRSGGLHRHLDCDGIADLVIRSVQGDCVERPTWSYLDDPTDQGTAGRRLALMIQAGRRDLRNLGFTEGDEATLIQSGATTYYFRHSFSVADLGTLRR
ncbi:MAG: hypothetical protein Ct9H300mP8_06440 [Gammaproteobacteria bacterium]|nr:MAG: hypothetical protein Ct9H300mP8_06440 [Gammaproteobacteria bacterium]